VKAVFQSDANDGGFKTTKASDDIVQTAQALLNVALRDQKNIFGNDFFDRLQKLVDNGEPDHTRVLTHARDLEDACDATYVAMHRLTIHEDKNVNPKARKLSEEQLEALRDAYAILIDNLRWLYAIVCSFDPKPDPRLSVIRRDSRIRSLRRRFAAEWREELKKRKERQRPR
jgi:Na+/phosphate symporter